MKARAGITIACFCAGLFACCGASSLRAQAPAPAQTTPPSRQPVEAASRDSSNELLVTVGKSVLVDCAHSVIRISVGLGDVVEATATSPSEVLVNGKAPGETSLIVWEEGGERQFFNVTVRASSLLRTIVSSRSAANSGQNCRVSLSKSPPTEASCFCAAR